MSNSLDLDQAGHFVGPDLGPNCFLLGYQQTTLVDKEFSKKQLKYLTSSLSAWKNNNDTRKRHHTS